MFFLIKKFFKKSVDNKDIECYINLALEKKGKTKKHINKINKK